MIRDYFYDLSIACVLGIELYSDLLSEIFSTDLILSVYDIRNKYYYSHPTIFELSRDDYANELLKLFSLEIMNELRIIGHAIGHNFNLSDVNLDQIYTFPRAKIEGIENQLGLIIPVYTLVLHKRFNNSFHYKHSVNSGIDFNTSIVNNVREYYLNKRLIYWKNIYGEENPSIDLLKEFFLETGNFLKYV